MQLTLDVTPTLVRSAGVKNYVYYWARALIADTRGHDVSLFPYIRSLGELNHDQGQGHGIPNWRLFLLAAQNGRLAPLARFLIPKAGIFHTSSQLRYRPRCSRLTSTVHDLTCWLMPEMHTAANIEASKEIAQNIWMRADGLMTGSESARQDAVRVLGISPDRLTVIYHGVPEAYFSVTSINVDDVRVRYSLKKPYVLAVGTVEPRKNLDRLLNSWERLPGDVHDAFDLVLAGPVGWKNDSFMQRLDAAKGAVRYLGYVPEADLPALTAGAICLAYPSLYEGFGFPLAQAMACGVPSLTSNVSSLPEVAAGSAVLIDPLSEAEMTAGLLRLLTSESLRRELGERGRIHAAANYRWPEIARRSWEFFEAIA